ncbi:MAG TPA: TonB-dependent receptor [Steroidobacteraceae bacterium]|nr:TonB-dependent receptor [Steroidobacteraceae bacterium]
MRNATGFALLLSCAAGRAFGADSGIESLKRMSLLELTQVEVTSVSRSAQPLGEAAAAIAVLTHQDILRSGATSIPEALRGVPGIHVGQRNANSWAVASRGFSSINSEKLLVLSDTRSIYTPLVSGVRWDVQNYLMEDIERIEVIRGPGATQWGSNAVNGVINITTRNARDTQGLYAEAGTGSEDRARLALRYGGRAGSGHFRVFGQYFERDSSELVTPAESPDDWHMGHLGFRADWQAGSRDELTLQGDWYDGRVGQIGPAVVIIGRPGPQPPLRVKLEGGNLLGRWKRTLDADSTIELRAYFDHTRQDDPSYLDTLDTVDLDFQHDFALDIHRISWGLNFRHTDNRNTGKGIFAVDPPRSGDALYGGFVQDQVALRDWLQLTVGTKLEQNDFSGFEIQPSVRMAAFLSHGQTAWAAVSRAARVPTRLERDVAIEVTQPGEDPSLQLLGNRSFNSEKLLAYELGYRRQVSPTLAVDLAAFLNRYRDLASLEIGDSYIDPDDGREVLPIINQNLTDGRAVGAEALVSYSPQASWRLTASYSYLDLNIDPHGQDINRGQFADGSTPRHQLGLRAAVDIGPVQLDAFLRHVSRIRRDPQIVSGEGIKGYTDLDLRLAYSRRQLQLVLALQNLLHHDRLEFGAPDERGGVERSLRASVIWRTGTAE